MSEKATLYDKTGAAFSFDHEHNGTLYVRPLVKVVMQSNYHGDDFHDEEEFEPAGYIVAKEETDLFYAPPVEAVQAEVSAKQAELQALKTEAQKAIGEINSQRSKVKQELAESKHQLEQWMKTHKIMSDLGKLLDGKVLYPLTVSENSYHRGRNIPTIPSMSNAAYLSVTSGNFETGKQWSCKRYADDSYRQSFQFFDTEEERSAVIRAEFDATCELFRQNPDFKVDIYTTTNLHYGTLLEWVKTHPMLSIPDDIKAMKAANDAELVERRKATLAAELAAIEKAEGQ